MERLLKVCFSILIFISFWVCVLWPDGSVFAQSKGGGAPKKTNVDFEDQLIQGDVQKPELFYLLQKKQFNFGKLIKLRENFIPEMQKTSEDIEKAK